MIEGDDVDFVFRGWIISAIQLFLQLALNGLKNLNFGDSILNVQLPNFALQKSSLGQDFKK